LNCSYDRYGRNAMETAVVEAASPPPMVVPDALVEGEESSPEHRAPSS
jgi:hypothetical protein